MPPQIYFLVPVLPDAPMTRAEFLARLEELSAAAKASGVTVTRGSVSQNSVVVNFEYATKGSAEKVTDLLAANGYHMTWNNVMFDGEDELWEPAAEMSREQRAILDKMAQSK